MQGGREFYDAVLQWHTSTQMTPQEVHDMGVEEVAAIRNGVDQLLVQLGADNKTFQQFAIEARADPSQRFSSREEALGTYRKILASVEPKLATILPADTLTGEFGIVVVHKREQLRSLVTPLAVSSGTKHSLYPLPL